MTKNMVSTKGITPPHCTTLCRALQVAGIVILTNRTVKHRPIQNGAPADYNGMKMLKSLLPIVALMLVA
ncbi:MAG: hypothetical protein QGH66_03915, partial [Dehalococcoidia bacterium]|nr:hypothetical protein [Dehalococcoidia bacterium]